MVRLVNSGSRLPRHGAAGLLHQACGPELLEAMLPGIERVPREVDQGAEIAGRQPAPQPGIQQQQLLLRRQGRPLPLLRLGQRPPSSGGEVGRQRRRLTLRAGRTLRVVLFRIVRGFFASLLSAPAGSVFPLLLQHPGRPGILLPGHARPPSLRGPRRGGRFASTPLATLAPFQRTFPRVLLLSVLSLLSPLLVHDFLLHLEEAIPLPL